MTNIWEQNIREWYEKSETSRLNYLDLASIEKPSTKELAHNIAVIYDRVISTGLAMEIPYGMYGRIAPRSGLALLHGIDVGAGVIDPDYRGEIKVLLFNHNQEEFEVRAGDRIAQIIFEKISLPRMVEKEGRNPCDVRNDDKNTTFFLDKGPFDLRVSYA